MPSPFPGMDPNIEARNRWPDFHHAFITDCRTALNARLPEDYIATIDERVQSIKLTGQRPRVSLPDLSVARDLVGSFEKAADTTGGVATLAPHVVPQSVEWLDEPTEAYIEIFHLPDYQLVTGVEVLSPSNKVNPGRTTYLAKRRDLLHHGVHLVEIDLLLEGERLPMLSPLPQGDYYVFVTRCPRHDICNVYSWSVRRVLPSIQIPLQSADADVELDLAAVFRTTYETGRYGRLLRHQQPAVFQLSDADMEWAVRQAAHC
jgi:hypothetical protein